MVAPTKQNHRDEDPQGSVCDDGQHASTEIQEIGHLEAEHFTRRNNPTRQDSQISTTYPARDLHPRSLWSRYKKAVLAHPVLIAQFESLARTASYTFPGMFPLADELSECLFGASKLVTFFNDGIMRYYTLSDAESPTNETGENAPSGRMYVALLSALTVMEHLAVVVEVITNALAGPSVHNQAHLQAPIVVLELARFAARCTVLLQFKGTLLASPPLSDVDRTAIACGECGGVVRHGCCGALSTDDSFLSMSDDDEFAQFCPDCGQSLKVADVVRNADVARVSVGRRTGRILRTPTRPSSQPRNGSDPAECDTCSERKQRLTRIKLTQRCLALPVSNPLTPHRMVAELAYISRPIVYLTSASVWGRSSWSAWLLSLLTEAVGVWSLRGQQGFSAAETEEVNRRRISLFLYLLRSPFYSKYTQGPLLALLGRIKKSLPWFSIFVDSIVHYLEYWHGLHMCTWAS
eukprot:m.972460 g.972460  ORF g.972460 m.972460 type:complete len:464 (-) comp23930_c0_seq7:1654-3045(-)